MRNIPADRFLEVIHIETAHQANDPLKCIPKIADNITFINIDSISQIESRSVSGYRITTPAKYANGQFYKACLKGAEHEPLKLQIPTLWIGNSHYILPDALEATKQLIAQLRIEARIDEIPF